MKILIRGTNWVGDAVMTIPAIRKLRRLFPDAHITLQTRQWAEGIFRDAGIFDEIITPESLGAQVRMLRQRRFDLAVIFPNSFRSALAARLGGAKRIFGYASERRSLLLSDPVPIPIWKETRHEAFYYLELVDAVERSYFQSVTGADELEPKLVVPDIARERARNVLARFGVDQNKAVVALAAGSTNSDAKRWHPESFARLNDRLQAELGATVILLGSPDEAHISRRVVEVSSHAPVDLTGTTDIGGAAAILSEVDLLISNDMGLAHLGPAVATPTIVIFGPTNPVTTRPFSEKAAIITAAVECAPCMLRRCPIDHRCMTRVSVDEVFDQAKRSLESWTKPPTVYGKS